MSVKLTTDLKGKINNLRDFKGEALQPLFETLINAIQAIEEKTNKLEEEKITISIDRVPSISEDFGTQPITDFTIEDTGIGFTENNFNSFLTSDSTYKFNKGCKGIGRFFWLKAFDSISVESNYFEGDKLYFRSFSFDIKSGVQEKGNNEIKSGETGAKIKLHGFKKEYQSQNSAYKTTSKIAQRILEHCLHYFILQKAPKIILIDGGEKISINDLFKELEKNIEKGEFKVDNLSFDIYHLKLHSTIAKMHKLVLCAHSREVYSEDISKILGTKSEFEDDGKKFIYSTYITGKYLDEKVDAERMGFNMPDQDDLTGEISKQRIVESALNETKGFLKEYLEQLKIQKKEIIDKFVSNNPSLRAIPKYSPEVYGEIDPSSSEEKINEVLHKYKGKTEYEIKLKSAKILKSQNDSKENIESDIAKITSQLDDFQKDQLAEYIVNRKLIINLLEKKLGYNNKSDYFDEKIIHDLLFPRKTSSEDIMYESQNLWLIDERLNFHSFATSDLQIPTLNKDNKDRPDILIFHETDDDRIARSVSIIELKKPERKTHPSPPTDQVYNYIRKIQDSTIKHNNGLRINVDDSTRFYCYIICSITDEIKIIAENNNFIELKNNLGYYSFNNKLKAYTEILAYDQILADAKKRQKIFFDKLGLK